MIYKFKFIEKNYKEIIKFKTKKNRDIKIYN